MSSADANRMFHGASMIEKKKSYGEPLNFHCIMFKLLLDDIDNTHF